MSNRIAALAAVAAMLCACSEEPAPTPKPTPVATPTPAPTTGFQRMIYDTQGYVVIRDRETGCQWIGVTIYTDQVGAIVPRNHRVGDEIQQLCTPTGDPMSRPIKVSGEHGMFQPGPRDQTRTDSYIYSFRDIETGCEWIVSNGWSMNGVALSIQPRTMMEKGRVRQICRP